MGEKTDEAKGRVKEAAGDLTVDKAKDKARELMDRDDRR